MRLLEVLDPLLSNFAPTFSDCCKGCKGSSYALMSWPTNSTQSSFETFLQTCGQIKQLTVKVVLFLSVFLPCPKVRLKIHYATKNTNKQSFRHMESRSDSQSWRGIQSAAKNFSAVVQNARKIKISCNVRLSNFAMGTILGKGFAQAQVHTEFIARVPKAQML